MLCITINETKAQGKKDTMKLKDAIKSIGKATGAVASNQTDLTKITDWLSTGSYAINRCITGDIYKGFPQGRISIVYGES